MNISKSWVHSLLYWIDYVQWKDTTSRARWLKLIPLSLISYLSQMAHCNIGSSATEPVLNWDQTAVKIVPINILTMELHRSKHVELVGLQDNQQITAVFGGILAGDFLQVQLVHKGIITHFPSMLCITSRLGNHSLIKPLVNRDHNDQLHQQYQWTL